MKGKCYKCELVHELPALCPKCGNELDYEGWYDGMMWGGSHICRTCGRWVTP